MANKTEKIETDKTEETLVAVPGKIRNHENYFGLQAQAFTCANEFELTPNSLRFGFDTWISIASFERGDAPVERLKKEFYVQDSEIVVKDNPFFADLEEIAFNLCNVGGRGYQLDRLFLTTVGKFLTVELSSPDGTDKPRANKYADALDKIVGENQATVGAVVAFMIGYAKENDEFLAQSDLVK